MNWWGEIYADLSDYHAPNTRVAVKNGKLLVLYEGDLAWEILQASDDIGGGAWTEDFTHVCGAIDMRTEPDGSRSMVPREGCNAHFWPKAGFAPISRPVQAVLSIAHVRLIVADPLKPDDRESSAYILALGADWRKLDSSCPNDICAGVGHGRYIQPTSQWKGVVMSTLSWKELESFPMPPQDIFLLPDGTYPSD